MEIVVRQGDTLWLYSQIFQIPLILLLHSNPNLQPTNLKRGARVQIPGFLAQDYLVSRDDTFWSIASKREIPLQQLLFMNRQFEPAQLTVGAVIQIPIRVIWRLVSEVKNYDYGRLTHDIRALLSIYPFLKRNTIGHSVMGKSILELTLGSGEKKVHANGAFHANEWLTTPLLMLFLNDYLLSLTNHSPLRGLHMLPLYMGTQLSLVPMVNPDGVNLVIHGAPSEEPLRSHTLQLNNEDEHFSNWKANIRGVDLNNQFPAKWELEKARKPKERGPRDYPGEQPLTEPEALAMAQLTRKRSFDRVLAFHSQGKEIYWGFEGLEPPISESIVTEFARVSAYKAVRYIDSYAGYKDWFIQDWKRAGFTIEVGSGVNPLPLLQFDEIYAASLGILLASLYM